MCYHISCIRTLGYRGSSYSANLVQGHYHPSQYPVNYGKYWCKYGIVLETLQQQLSHTHWLLCQLISTSHTNLMVLRLYPFSEMSVAWVRSYLFFCLTYNSLLSTSKCSFDTCLTQSFQIFCRELKLVTS